jgi:hypothetical protein
MLPRSGMYCSDIGAAWEVQTNLYGYVYFILLRTVQSFERTLRRSRLNCACIPCGVHLPVPRVQCNGQSVLLMEHSPILYRQGNSLCTRLSFRIPPFFTLRFTLLSNDNNNAAICGEKRSVPCSVFLQFRTIDDRARHFLCWMEERGMWDSDCRARQRCTRIRCGGGHIRWMICCAV